MRIRKIFAFAFSVFFVSSLWAQEFTTKMETIFTAEQATAHLQHIKSAIDSKGALHVVFISFDNHFFYGTNQKGTWNFEQLQYFDTEYKEQLDVVKLTNIAVDNHDNIHIVTFDQYGEKIVYGKKPASTGEFKLQTVKLYPEPLRLWVYGGMGEEYSDLAVDKNGGLHLICKSDYTDKREARFQQCATYFHKPASSDTWQLQVLIHDTQFSERNWFYGNNSSIACYEDKVYVAIGGSNKLHFGTSNISGGTWDMDELLYTPDEFINSGKDMLSLAISPNGSIKFAFYDRTDDTESPWQGLTIFNQNNCKNNEWQGYNFSERLPNKIPSVNSPAVAFDSNGKFYIAFGRNEYTLWHQACDCNSEYKKIFAQANQKADQIDMVIGKDNTVYTFFTSVYDNKLRLLTAKPNGSTRTCNYPPSIINYTGKTNLKPGEKWTATITASDPECDKIWFESIIHNDMFTIEDHGNGTATITAVMPDGEGKGTPGLSIWALDEKHPNTNSEVSVISFKLVITNEGEEKGSIKIENKCTGNKSGKFKPIGTQKNTLVKTIKETPKPDKNTATTNFSESESSDCKTYLDKFELWVNKYIVLKKKLNKNPLDIKTAMEISKMAPEIGNWGLEWQEKYVCTQDENFVKRYEEIAQKLDEVN